MTEIERLLLFNEKVERLRGGRLVKLLREEGFGMRVDFGSEARATVVRKGPDDDAIHAAILTVRFFIQDNEPCSLRNLSLVYADKRIPQDLRDEFSEFRRILNNYLDSPGRIDLGSKSSTPRQTFEAVVYGDLSHSTVDKREHFDKLFRHEFISTVSFSEFMTVLIAIIKLVFNISYRNQKIIDEKYLN